MKLYQFFRRFDEDNALMNVKEKYPLYAVTINKKHAKRFETSRSKDAFIKRVSYIEKEQATEFINAHRGSYLQWYDLDTFNIENGKKTLSSVQVLMTDFEAEFLNSIDNYLIYSDYAGIDPDIFKIEYIKDLYTLNYVYGWLVSNIESVDKVDTKLPSLDELNITEGYIDELKSYIDSVKDQLNPETFTSIIKIKKGH